MFYFNSTTVTHSNPIVLQLYSHILLHILFPFYSQSTAHLHVLLLLFSWTYSHFCKDHGKRSLVGKGLNTDNSSGTSYGLTLVSVLQYPQVTLLNWQVCWCDSSWLNGSTTSHSLLGHLTVRKTHSSVWVCERRVWVQGGLNT